MGNLGALLIVLLAFAAAHLLRFGDLAPSTAYLIALLTALLLGAVVFPATGAFRSEFRFEFLRRVRRILAGWAVVVTALVALSAMFKVTEDYSRIWFGYWVLAAGFGLLLGQIASQAWLRRRRNRPGSRHKVVLVGAEYPAARVEKMIARDPAGEFDLVARFGRSWPGAEVRPLSELAEYVANHAVHDVWIAFPLAEHNLLDQALEALRQSMVDVHVIPDLHQYRLLNQSVSEWSGLPVINLSGTPMTGVEWALKNVLDRIGAALLLLLFAPLMALIWLVLRIQDGPAIFRQKRHGIGGEPIEVLKFRTMNRGADDDGQVDQASRDDPRVTPFGRILRRTSLDELPQFINVLKGEMSLVGPRPHAVEHNSFYGERIPRYVLRHKVRPGITGWAQVNGFRGITDTPEKMEMRIEHDLWYIQNWSLWLDLKILMMTPLVMIHRNAY